MLPFKRGAFHLAVQAQVITPSRLLLPLKPPPSLPLLAEAGPGDLRREPWADCFSSPSGSHCSHSHVLLSRLLLQEGAPLHFR